MIDYTFYKNTDKQTLLFIHGLGANFSQFENQYQYFKDDFQILGVTLRGHENKLNMEESESYRFSLENMSRDVLEVLQYLNISKFHIIGSSLGGNIGYEILKQKPQKVLSLTTFGTTAVLKKSKSFLFFLQLVYKIFPMKFISKMGSSMATTYGSKIKIQQLLSNANKNTILKIIPHIINFDYRDTILDSNIPCLIMIGEKDKGINSVLSSTLSNWEKKENFHCKTIKNSGHFINLEQPSIFNNTLEAFLNGK